MHALARSRIRPLKNLLIASFRACYRPDMSEAAQPDPFSYPDFNAFFTRALAPGARLLDLHPAVLVSPVDGTVSELGRLEDGRLVQAKGRLFTLEALLDSASCAQRFAGGAFATLYLAPRDYHRIHMPLAGTLRAAWYIPGSLFSVNAVTAAAVPGLYTRNERVCCLFENGPLVFALVMVGALLVGSIFTVWHGEITPGRARRRAELPLPEGAAAGRLAKGAQLGGFNMGSTVIVLIAPPGQWRAELTAGTPVRMGQMLAQLPEAPGPC